MAVRTWEAVKIRFCDHAGSEVALEAEKVYPMISCPTNRRGCWRIAAHVDWNAARTVPRRVYGPALTRITTPSANNNYLFER